MALAGGKEWAGFLGGLDPAKTPLKGGDLLNENKILVNNFNNRCFNWSFILAFPNKSF